VAGSAEAIAQVDANHNGIPEWDVYPHDITDVYFKISTRQIPIAASPTVYTSHGPLLSPGVMYRSYILSDSEVSHSEYATAVRTNPADAWEHGEGGLITGTWPGTTIRGAIEQITDGASCAQYGTTAPCTIRRSVLFYRFRGMDLWGSVGVIFDNPEYPVGSRCPWEMVR
jgi:hypothetical protein